MLNLWSITFFIFQGGKDHMKKNLRIVSAAAAALLAVAPVAASAMPVSAAINNIELGGTSAPAVTSDVTLSSDLKAVTKANAVLTDTATGNVIARYNWDGKISGTISASWGGQTYTGNLTPGESTVSVWWYNKGDANQANGVNAGWNEVKKGQNGLYALEPGAKYYVEVPAVAFNFGTANANKKNLSLSASNGMKLIVTKGNTRSFVDKINFDTDANGAMVNPSGVEVLIPVTPVDATNANATVAQTGTKKIMHSAYTYEIKDGKATRVTSADTLHAYQEIPVYGTTTVNGKKYYRVSATNEWYINAGNVDGTERTLNHNSYVYNNMGKRVKSEGTWKKGSKHTTYGSAMNIKGHRMYRVNKNRYVKVVNFDKN